MTVTAYLGLGSNIEAERNLAAMVRLLSENPALSLVAISPVYRTPPWGHTEQPDFLNAVAAAATSLDPETLLDALQAVEARLGRRRGMRYGPRTADVDLLLYRDAAIATERLRVPHSLLHERAFVLAPLCDLAPHLRHPVLGETMAELLARVDATGVRRVPFTLQAPPPPGDARS